MPLTLLLVKDPSPHSKAIQLLFEQSWPDTTVKVAPTLAEALRHDKSSVDTVLLDLDLPDSSGLVTLTAALRHFAPVPVVVLMAVEDEPLAQKVLQFGAHDYLQQAVTSKAAIHRVIRYAVRHSSERSERRNQTVLADRTYDAQLLPSHRLENLGTLAGIAHDLNNIQMAILSSAEFLRRVPLPSTAAEQAVERIATSSRRAADILQRWLDFARDLHLDNRTKPARLVEEVERILRANTPRSIDIETSVDADVHPIACDPSQVLRVILNLGLNARDAMPKGGVLTICAENAVMDDRSGDRNEGGAASDYVLLSVSDTGGGIPPEVMGSIFEPFFTTKEEGVGTGLGLAIAESIIKNVGGHIKVISEPGSTIFKVYLPASNPTGEQPVKSLRA